MRTRTTTDASAQVTILRRFWPTLSPCPACKLRGKICHEHRKISNRGRMQYRRCTCCGQSYSVGAIAEERLARGDSVSRLVFL